MAMPLGMQSTITAQDIASLSGMAMPKTGSTSSSSGSANGTDQHYMLV